MLASSLAMVGCRGPSGETATAPSQREPETPQLADQTRRPQRSSWGRASPELDRALLEAELARDPSAAAIVEGLDGASREAALWALARIGGDAARDQISAALDAPDLDVLATAALLEVPRSDADQPPEPTAPGPWASLEDGLWTRYALVDPAASERARALLLAIARVGGSRSIARLAVDLAELPGPDHDGAAIERWASAMEALGLLCARGHALDAGTVSAVVAGIEIRAGVDPELPRAALYALSRCTRSSSELLIESREELVARLEAHVHAHTPSAGPSADLAWRSFAGLGELPEDIPAGVLAPAPTLPWTTEVEAVRALGGSPHGAEVVRERLAAARFEDFAGPRQHVLLEALRALRADIAAAPGVADAQLVTVASWLVTARRSEDPRTRKLAALALCELRLLQAIRSGQTTQLVGCERLAGAPAVDLPTSLLVNLEVEALLRATRPDAPGEAKLSVAEIDDAAVLADRGEDEPLDPGRRARIGRLLELARDPDPARATPAIHALAEIDDPGVGPVLRRALVSADPGVLAAAATAVAVRSVDAGKRDPSLVELLEAIVATRVAAPEIEARLAAIEALGALGRAAIADIDPNPSGDPADSSGPGEALERSLVPLAADPHVAVRRRAREALLGHDELLARFDAEFARAQASAGPGRASPFPARLDEGLASFLAAPVEGLRVQTSAGSFTIEFAGIPAPINQANLVALAREGYYEGLSFHRIVPGFVVQGGDPRGDGYGGPGYVVPCEWSNLSYARGTVGIALAGKDTGGSQFFVTQTPQLHLDARYTIVGQVGEGLEVIDLLLPGDRIEAVEILERGG